MSLSLALSATPETLVFTAALAATGFSASFIGGVIGAGGGLVAIPLIQFLFMRLGLDSGTAMMLTVGTCSFSMIFGSILSTWREARRGLVDWAIVRRWALPMIGGVIVAQMLGFGQNGTAMKVMFAALVSGLALYMMFGSEKWRLHKEVPQGPVWGAYGAVIGFVCSLVGTGGTSLAVPLMHACGVTLRRAITNSAVIGMFVGIPATFFYIQAPTIDLPATIGNINLLAAAILVGAGWLGRPLGLWVQRRLSAEVLHKAFVAALLLTATRLCWLTLSA